jgi:DNA replication protein DnaC
MRPVEEILPEIAADTLKASMETSSSTEREWREGVEEERQPQEPCPICSGMGFVTREVPLGHPDYGKAVACECQQKEIEARRLAQFQAISQLDALQDQTFESFMPEGIGLTEEKQRNLKLAYQRCRDYAGKPEGWLLLRGGYGCGKTHLAAAIANHQLSAGEMAILVTVPDLLDFLRATFAPNSEVSFDERLQQIKNASLLILDDFGTESGTPWAQEKLFQILNYRYNGRLPTVITTNYELEEIELRVRSRLVDPGLVQIITILAPDFRRAGVDQEQSELSSLSLHFHQTLGNFDVRKGELPRPEQENLQRALDLAKSYAEAPRNWLVLTGPYGSGKTHLAAGIANQWRKQGYPVLFISVPDLLDDLRATFSPTSSISYSKRFKEIRSARYLILDDLGTESATNWAKEKLHQIFDYRYNARLPTVITTATPLEDLDTRLTSRMLDPTHCTIFGIIATSYRGSTPTVPKSRQTRSTRRR